MAKFISISAARPNPSPASMVEPQVKMNGEMRSWVKFGLVSGFYDEIAELLLIIRVFIEETYCESF